MTSYPIPPNYANHILVASPSNAVRQRVLESLRSPLRHFEQTTGGAEALVHLESGRWQVLFLDRRLPDLDAEELSQTVRQRYLRIVFDVSLVSAEHLTYREFLQRVPEKTYLASCELAPVGATALLQLDLAIAFPIIDVMLGAKARTAKSLATPPRSKRRFSKRSSVSCAVSCKPAGRRLHSNSNSANACGYCKPSD